jgi:hypothetical protein
VAYDGPEYYYVIYKAIGDFGNLMRDAAQAKAALQGMSDAVKATSAAEVQGAAQAAAAREKDIAAIRSEAQALSQLEQAAKQTNIQLLYGGRNDMSQHLSDIAKELEYTTLLNRQKWLGFSSVQQAMSYRQQMYQLALLENKAHFAGYLTADQYLGFLMREIGATAALSAVIRDRTSAISAETNALLAHANALMGTHQTGGQLGEQLTGVNAYAAALTGLPPEVVTDVTLDTSRAMANLAAYRAALLGLPHSEHTDVFSSLTELNRSPLTGIPSTVTTEPLDVRRIRIEVTGVAESVAETRMLAAELAELQTRSRLRLGVDFTDVEAARIEADRLGEAFQALPAQVLEARQAIEHVLADDAEEIDYLAEAMQLLDRQEAHPRIALEGIVMTEDEIAALDAQMEALDQQDTVINVDGSGAVTSIEEVGRAAQEADDDIQHMVQDLVNAARDRFVIAAQFDDADALREARHYLEEIESLQADAAHLPAGMGGPAGGGGGGGPPPPPRGGPPGDEPPGPGDGPAWRAIADELDRVDAMFRNVRRDAAAAGNATARAAGQAQAFIDPLVASTGGWFGLNSQLRLFAGLLPGAFGTVAAWHVVLDFIIEFLAVFVPAIVTAIAGLTAFGIAGSDAGKAVYDRLLAIHTAADATGQSIAPLTGNLEKLHAQVRPQVWQVYGDAIDVATAKTGLFNQLAVATGRELDRLAGRLAVDLSRSGGGLQTFLSVGAHDLAGLGEFFHNIGTALLSFIKITQETHVDQYFLDFFIGLSKVLDLITKLPTPLLAVAVGLHAFWLWGGLAATVVLQLLTPLRSLALALGAVDAASVTGGLASVEKDAPALTRLRAGLTDIAAGFAAMPAAVAGFRISIASLGAFLVNPITLITAAAAAIGFFTYEIVTANDETAKWIQTLNQQLSASSAFTVVSSTVSDLAAVTNSLAVAQKTGTGNATELAGAQEDLNSKLGTELSHVGQIAKAYGTDFRGALELLNTAGVKTSDIFGAQGDVWAGDLQQVKGLVAGYKAMGQGLTDLQQDVSVQLVTTSDQVKAVQALNQAWDQFQSAVAGPVNSFLALDQSVSTFLADASASGATMTGLGTDILTVAGQTQQAVPTISNAAITLQQQFQTVYGNVQQLFDAFRNAQGLSGGAGGSFDQFVKDAVAALLPLAGSNKTAAAEISQLAQEAGGPVGGNLKELAKWAGNVKDPMLAMYDASEKASAGAADLSSDAARLTTSLQQDLQPAMANAIFNAHGGQKVFNDFAAALVKSGPGSKATIDAARKMADELLAVSGNSANAEANFVGFAEAMGLGKKQAEDLWKKVSDGHAPLKQIRDDLAKASAPPDNLAKNAGYWAQRKAQDIDYLHNVEHVYDLVNHYLAVGWGDVFVGFQHDVADKIYDFFVGSSGKDLKGFISNSLKLFDGFWSNVAHYFGQYLVSDVANFFKVQLKNWLDEIGTYWTNKWMQAWHGFLRAVYSPMHDFFTNDIPSWWDELGRGWLRLWSDAWTGFNRTILLPIENFFTATLPSAMSRGLRAGMDSVIGGLNTVIGWINAVTGVVGVHIGSIPKLAHGGSVPGTGDEDATHIIAMPGEYMIRKPARMALQAAYGPSFMDHLNQADSWLGAGSRGSAATQQGSNYGRYASGGGIFGGIENWLGSVGGDLESLAKAGWHGITSAAGDVAKWGEKAVFDAMWDTTARPALAGMEHLGTPGALAASWLTDAHNGVENWINGKTSAANATAGSAGPGGGVPAANAALARRLKPAWGSGTEWVSWNDLEMREAGWNQFATNPTSGAYGIPQALPPTKMPFAAQRAGGSNPTAQIEWMISYITSVYGDPINADAHERSSHWYAAGGPVTSAIRGVTPNREQREAMAVGSYLLTRWNTDAYDRKRDEYGAWLIDLHDHKGFSAKQARNAYDSAKLLAPYYDKGVKASTPAYWRVHPEQAALHAYEAASTAAGTHWSTPSNALLNEAWSQARAAFPLPAEKLSRSISGKDVAEWSKDAARMWPAWEDALKQWRLLESNTRPKGKHAPSAKDWLLWVNQRRDIEALEKQAGTLIAPLFAGLHDPAVLKASMFTGAEHGVERWASALSWAHLPLSPHHGSFARAENDLHHLENYIGGAGHAWRGLYGQYLVPGIQVRPPGQAPITVDLNKLITGFPFGEGGSGGGDYGFAAGGSVPSLSNVAGMFSGGMAGMAGGGVVPSLFVPGLSATLSKQLSASASGQLPRTLADGAANKVGMHVDNLTINNPMAEKPSDSITRASNRLAFLGGRGMI